MISTILHQLTRNMCEDDVKKAGLDTYFIDHTAGVYPVAASGVPFDAKYIGVKGDVIADLTEDLAAEQKARVTYDNLLRLIDDRDICEPLKFLRERELVHYQRFGEAKLLFYTAPYEELSVCGVLLLTILTGNQLLDLVLGQFVSPCYLNLTVCFSCFFSSEYLL